jgi:homoserine kinase
VHERPMLRCVTVAVPATTANLGPGFDTLALTLDLWNEVTVSLEKEGLRIVVSGEGAGRLPDDASNPIAQAALDLFAQREAPPSGLTISCRNAVPPASGLGSSATAVLAGLLAANTLLGAPLTAEELMRRAVRQEGHPDNVAAALYGGLVVVVQNEAGFLVRRFDVPRFDVAVVLPSVATSTRSSRESLPDAVPLAAAVHNIGRAALVVEALRSGDLELLGHAMDDRLHQERRLTTIPGAAAALRSGREAGAGAVALSGSGPSLIAFAPSRARAEAAADAMAAALSKAGTASRTLVVTTTTRSARLQVIPL